MVFFLFYSWNVVVNRVKTKQKTLHNFCSSSGIILLCLATGALLEEQQKLLCVNKQKAIKIIYLQNVLIFRK